MINKFVLKHPIDRHILTLLSHSEYIRFIDLKTKSTDTNLLTYHLKQLQSKNFIKKVQNTYTLSQNGLVYVNDLTKSNLDIPYVTVALLVQNGDGDVLLQKRKEQPYINTWALPETFVTQTSLSLLSVANELIEGYGWPQQRLRHVGTAYVRVAIKKVLVSASFVHVFRFESDSIVSGSDFKWVQPHHLPQQHLTPGTEAIVTRSFFGDAFFFEEFNVEAIIPEEGEGI